MNIELLRRATAEDHSAVEHAIPLMSVDLTLTEYIAVLRRMYGIVAAWESLSEHSAPVWLQPLLRARRRLPLLQKDLHDLNSSGAVLDTPTLPQWRSDAEFLGAMYVMEGSRLGGLFIAKHLEATLHFEAGQGDAYFRGFGPQTSVMWKELTEILSTRISDAETAVVIETAKSMFQIFGAWMTRNTALPLLSGQAAGRA